MQRLLTPVLALALSLSLAACGGDEPKPSESGNTGGTSASSTVFKFSAIPDREQALYEQRFAPVQAWLEEQLGVSVEFVYASNYADTVENFKNGEIHGAWFGGLSGVQARDAVAGAKAVIQGAADPKFYSYFIANKKSGLSKSDSFPMDLKGKSFTFGSKGSTSGRLMPEFFIRENTGGSPKDFFGTENNYAGSHTNTLKAVNNGDFEAGALNYKVYDKALAAGEIDEANCYVIWKTPTYADYNLTIRGDLDKTFGAGFEAKLVKAFRECKNRDVLGAFERQQFIDASNDDFSAIETVARDLGFIR